MITRELSKTIPELSKGFPIVGLVGPRQAGKTTLAKSLFPNYDYINLEQLDLRQFASDDPRGFLKQHNKHVIFDEIQRVPELFSYIQAKVDEDKIPAQFVLTGSQHFLMMQSISQSLAGRIALFTLYPLSYAELKSAKKNIDSVQGQILTGGYPRLYDGITVREHWLNTYVQTYLDRDISLISQIENLPVFEKFLQLIAGRTGQLLNYNTLSNDLGVAHNTIRSWINILEISGIVLILPPFFTNINKRLVKSPKIYMVDTGLACRLLQISSTEQLQSHPLYGNLFETFVVTEYIKNILNMGKRPELYFYRDSAGLEADIVHQTEKDLKIVEIKSSQTVPQQPFSTLKKVQKVLATPSSIELVYGGNNQQKRSDGDILGWSEFLTE
ncbi:MAG: AAA family ATPase [Candidatus Pacebacteria bacterium CG10_big_fil_rev_8_21_14_0_10_42_12]|nr:MAG: AAA family ATPase [Candidatus Pacebacteria bacterium CG10_big_fil_rev_8_21_14_0_10_42_12]